MEITTICEMYKNTGYSTDNTKRWIKSQSHNGYDESFDCSLLVVYFDAFTVIISTSSLEFAGARQ